MSPLPLAKGIQLFKLNTRLSSQQIVIMGVKLLGLS